MKTNTEATEPMTDDERAGITWWNNLTPVARSYWLSTAGTAIVAEAWACYKRTKDGKSVPDTGFNR